MQREARPRRAPLASDSLSLLDVLSSVGLVDHHAHGILADSPSLDEFRGLFSESTDPRQWPHIATGITYRRAMRELAELFGVEETENAVYEFRRSRPFGEYATTLLRATNTEWLLVDDGFPPPGTGIEWRRLGELGGCRAAPVLRIETHDEGDVAGAREAGFVGLKTIAAYRGGLDRVSDRVIAALEANEATGDPLPVQVHCGFGDADLHLWRSDPSYLKLLIERFRETPFVLLHCYPFVREAGWLAHVYGNVWFDLSLTIPHVARAAEHVREALELAPVSKLLYASDAARTPELYFLAAKWWREALAEVLTEALPPDEAEVAGRAILRDNALALYRLEQYARAS
jgi:uncharacterized protein